jgi:hypothetical protein
MTRWGAFLWLAVAGLGLTAGCDDDVLGCDDCSPVEQVQEKICDLKTHVCVPRVGGGWDGVILWEGDEDNAPDKCPEVTTNISFWGEEVLPPNMPPNTPAQTLVGCGFIEDGICEAHPDFDDDAHPEFDEEEDLDGIHYICAPRVEGWNACIVANSPRGCPPAYTAQTIVGSDSAGDLEWTVCCVGDAEGPKSPPEMLPETPEVVESHADKVMSPEEGIKVRFTMPRD